MYTASGMGVKSAVRSEEYPPGCASAKIATRAVPPCLTNSVAKTFARPWPYALLLPITAMSVKDRLLNELFARPPAVASAPVSSSWMSTTQKPFTPPSSLISFAAREAPLWFFGPNASRPDVPVRGRTVPIFSPSPRVQHGGGGGAPPPPHPPIAPPIGSLCYKLS